MDTLDSLMKFHVRDISIRRNHCISIRWYVISRKFRIYKRFSVLEDAMISNSITPHYFEKLQERLHIAYESLSELRNETDRAFYQQRKELWVNLTKLIVEMTNFINSKALGASNAIKHDNINFLKESELTINGFGNTSNQSGNNSNSNQHLKTSSITTGLNQNNLILPINSTSTMTTTNFSPSPPVIELSSSPYKMDKDNSKNDILKSEFFKTSSSSSSSTQFRMNKSPIQFSKNKKFDKTNQNNSSNQNKIVGVGLQTNKKLPIRQLDYKRLKSVIPFLCKHFPFIRNHKEQEGILIRIFEFVQRRKTHSTSIIKPKPHLYSGSPRVDPYNLVNYQF